MSRRTQAGFSLIELVAIIVLLSAGAVAIMGLYSGASRTLGSNQDAQIATQLAQECGEHIIAQRRYNATVQYAGITGATFCSAALPAPPVGFTVTVNITDPYAGAACPGTCKLAQINVAKAGDTLAGATLMLVDY